MCRFILNNDFKLNKNNDYTFIDCTFNYIPLPHQPVYIQNEIHMMNYTKVQENKTKFPEINENKLAKITENKDDKQINCDDDPYCALHTITEEIYHTLQNIIMYNKNIEIFNTKNHVEGTNFSTKYSLFTSIREIIATTEIFDMLSKQNKHSILGSVYQHDFYMPKSGKTAYVFKVKAENYAFNIIKWRIPCEEYEFYRDMIDDVTLFLKIKILKYGKDTPYFMIDTDSIILYDISDVWKSVIKGIYNETIIDNINYIWSPLLHENIEVVKQLNITTFHDINLAIKKAHEINNNTVFIMKNTKEIRKYDINEFSTKYLCKTCRRVSDDLSRGCCLNLPQKEDVWFEGNITLLWKNYHKEIIINFTALIQIIKYLEEIENLPMNAVYEQYIKNLTFYKRLLNYNKPENENESQLCIYPVKLFFDTINKDNNVMLRFYIVPKIWKNQKRIRITFVSIHSKSDFNNDLHFKSKLFDNNKNVNLGNNNLNHNGTNVHNNNSNANINNTNSQNNNSSNNLKTSKAVDADINISQNENAQHTKQLSSITNNKKRSLNKIDSNVNKHNNVPNPKRRKTNSKN